MGDIGHGFKFQRFDLLDYEDFGKVIDPALPELDRDFVDGTHTQSPNKYREKIPGLRNQGEFTLTLEYEDGGDIYETLIADFEDDSPRDWKGIMPDTSEWLFSGWVKTVGPEIPLDERITVDVTFQPNGQGTFAKATP